MATGKVELEPGTWLFPLPVVVVSVGDMQDHNLITLAWVGTLCSRPPMVGISVRPDRHSYRIIADRGEFVVNIPRSDQLDLADFCGTRSGRELNKFAALGLTPVSAARVAAPLVGEFPVNIECRVEQRVPLGSHELFVGRVLAVHAAPEVVLDGSIDPGRVNPPVYALERYYAFGEQVGEYGFTRRPRPAR
ncbi:MAG: flavin reductase family protein [Bacillota bacterium]|nr:flavin reductase family protein [Bacillota bacterium]MDI7249256.1 flavin reductase family protein [Bacillota bacterium]